MKKLREGSNPNPALKHTAMAQHEVNGNLFVRYNGEVYPSQDYQCDIKFITSDIGEQFFEFEFAYPSSPTNEKVLFSVHEEHKKRVINPFNLQYIVIGDLYNGVEFVIKESSTLLNIPVILEEVNPYEFNIFIKTVMKKLDFTVGMGQIVIWV